MKQAHGCGCCGRPVSETTIFCVDCQPHVMIHEALVLPFWDRTYFAQTGKPCPYQAGPVSQGER